LARPEISIHGRHTEYDVPVFDPNVLDATQFGGPRNSALGVYDDSRESVSFASFVWPFERFVLSAQYHNAGEIQGATELVSFDPRFFDTFVASTQLDAEAESFGLSAAFRVSDMISIGATIKRADFKLTSVSQSLVLDFSDVEFNFANPGAAALQIDERDAIRVTTLMDDDDFTWNFGVLLNPNGTVSAALVYKENGDFDSRLVVDYINVFDCNGLAGCTVPAVDEVTRLGMGTPEIQLPDVLTLGLAVRPSDEWLLSLQVDRIEYGDLPPPSRASLIFQQPVPVERAVDEFSWHAGVERTFIFDGSVLGMSLLNVRAGVFNDRDHDGYPFLNTRQRHYTFGIGTVIGEKFQLDLAAERAQTVDNVVLSMVYRF
ncbi:MAG TPA: outer membrane protein transport protein, partial [Xanthomonadales bacterium]|nr:outer membrane protein transport protein [Xanthomonadales bacterium]